MARRTKHYRELPKAHDGSLKMEEADFPACSSKEDGLSEFKGTLVTKERVDPSPALPGPAWLPGVCAC